MRAGIGDGVCTVISRKMRIGVVSVKTEGEDLHARIAAPGQKPADTVVDTAKIFGDDPDSGDLLSENAEQILSGSDDPAAVARVRRAVRNGIVIRESDKVIDPDHIIHIRHGFHPIHPPVIAMQAETEPPVEGIPPQLAIRRKIIRRNTGNTLRNPVPVQLEDFRMRPCIG